MEGHNHRGKGDWRGVSDPIAWPVAGSVTRVIAVEVWGTTVGQLTNNGHPAGGNIHVGGWLLVVPEEGGGGRAPAEQHYFRLDVLGVVDGGEEGNGVGVAKGLRFYQKGFGGGVAWKGLGVDHRETACRRAG